jgi:hypothetical protein
MFKVVKVLPLCLLLAACQTAGTTAVVTVERPTLVLPSVDNIHLNDIEWHVVNKNAKPGSEDYIDTAFGKAHSESLFAINPRDYEDLAVNQANLVKVIRQYQAQVNAYKQYYDAQATKDGNTKTSTAQGSTSGSSN